MPGVVVRVNDRLQRALPKIYIDRRAEIWLWYFINVMRPAQGITCDINAPKRRDQIAEAIESNPSIKNEILLKINQYLLPESALTWIKENERQSKYIQHSTYLATGHLCPLINTLEHREASIATIDTLFAGNGIHEKNELVGNIKQSWEKLISNDKYFDWFDGTDEESKTKIAWQIIDKKNPEITSQHFPPKTKNELLITLDLSILTTPEKILLIESIKKRWSQNKYRAKQNGKNQYNFILSDKAINRLDKLAETHEIKRTEVLEILLKMESENGEYISKHLNRLGDL